MGAGGAHPRRLRLRARARMNEGHAVLFAALHDVTPGECCVLTPYRGVLMRVRPSSVLPICALLLLPSCGSDATIVIDSPVVGSWTAVSVDGQQLPIVEEVLVGDLFCTLTLSSLEFTWHASGRYDGGDAVVRRCAGHPDTDISGTFRGRWRVQGEFLYMTPEGGSEQGSRFGITGSQLTITYTGDDGSQNITVFQRR
jgi:hypothetical protein